jgi:CubicO group peptidase (beta-lactamase class C family)
LDLISVLIEEGKNQGVFPGAVLWVQKGEQVIYQGAWGKTSLEMENENVSIETLFDVASLTKVIATTSAILLLIQKGFQSPRLLKHSHFSPKKINLDTFLEEILNGVLDVVKKKITLRLLLSHASGFPDTRPFYNNIRKAEKRKQGFLGSQQAKQQMYELVHQEPLVYEPGDRQLYSDLGFILLGECIERLSGETLDSFCKKEIFVPLGLMHTGFLPFPQKECPITHVAATERCPWRGKVLLGEVHDDNAYAMGGVAGHAGLFSTARDIACFAFSVLKSFHGGNSFFDSALIREFTQGYPNEWGLGWMMRTEPSSSGRFFSEASFGHLGFTGTSLWIDPVRDLIVVFLTNRVHPSRNNDQIKFFRPRLHDLIFKEMIHD